MIMNSNQLEELKVKYFGYMMDLKKSIRTLNKNIKSETETLNALLKEDKEYIDIITSINTGKGYYHDISMLPYDIKTAINSNKNYSEEQIANLKNNYLLALAEEKKFRERYEFLRSTAKARTVNIKNHKKNIANNRKKLAQRQKECNLNFSKVKEYDKILEKLNKETK